MNVSTSKYFVIRFVAKSLFNYRISTANVDIEIGAASSHEEDWDIYWTDGGVQPERLNRMQPYQRINHFPGMFQLSRKNNLARNLMKMAKVYQKEYKFFPKTYLLPAEYGEFKN